MNYNYKDVINGLNNGKIKKIVFSLNNYSHYKNCIIRRIKDENCGLRPVVRLIVDLVEDGSESISFLNEIKEEYKMFKLGRKGTFTLKQLWNNILIHEIEIDEFL